MRAVLCDIAGQLRAPHQKNLVEKLILAASLPLLLAVWAGSFLSLRLITRYDLILLGGFALSFIVFGFAGLVMAVRGEVGLVPGMREQAARWVGGALCGAGWGIAAFALYLILRDFSYLM